MKIIGVDPSITGTGLVFVDTKTKAFFCKRLRLKSTPDFEHLRKLTREVEKFIKKHKPEKIYIESPIFFPGRNRQTHIRTILYHALLRNLFLQLKLSYSEFAPTSVKLLFTGSGKATKGDIVRTCLYDHGRKIYDNNIGDAFAIAMAGYFKEQHGKRLKPK